MSSLRIVLALAVALVVAAPLTASAADTPRNVIVMIADGCGFNQTLAAQYYAEGAEAPSPYDDYVAFAIATYSASGEGYDPEKAAEDFNYVRSKSTDSAAAATALATGVKTTNGAIGQDPDGKAVRNLTEHAEDMGKATGVITSVPFFHATPAGFVAHVDKRGNYGDISRQMLNSGLEVIMGGGHPYYDENGKLREADKIEPPRVEAAGGEELLNAVREGKPLSDADGDGEADPWTFIDSRPAFQQLAEGDAPRRVFGLAPVSETLQQGRSGDDKADAFVVPLTDSVPTLEEMTKGALNVLEADPDGFFLMVEGGAVDWAGHDNTSGRLIEEMIDFRKAIAAVTAWVEANSSWDETLVIITGDHETGYLTGPGSDPEFLPVENKGKGNMPGMEWHSGSHTNSLLPIYVKGAGAQALVNAATETDPRRGKFLHHTDVANTIFGLWGADVAAEAAAN